jgi:hypothetical protein
MTDTELLRRFVEFSASVTAFGAFDLYGTDQAEAYLATVLNQAGEPVLRELLDGYQPGLEREILSSEELGPVARSIIKLWYSGVWYEPVPGLGQPPFVVSPAAYAEGLMWRAFGAHPTGAKAPGYGSWVEPPAIEDYAQGETR